MRVTDLFEGISDIVFHRTGFNNLIQILETDQFELRPEFAPADFNTVIHQIKDKLC